ncbi:hypothetical protein [Neosynechococcus sphagnicola]|uniref:hypothetical protein n=1 Tax=Neosynechococcus sphagnicola TaxID=1501145 RepID=UPI0012E038C5|nr:hypothetical protein [Neosynechococcus sphagnicola]
MKALVTLSVVTASATVALMAPALAGDIHGATGRFSPSRFVTSPRASLREVFVPDTSVPVPPSWRLILADGPPPDDKGTPGNRGGCGANGCGGYRSQLPPPPDPVSNRTECRSAPCGITPPPLPATGETPDSRGRVVVMPFLESAPLATSSWSLEQSLSRTLDRFSLSQPTPWVLKMQDQPGVPES